MQLCGLVSHIVASLTLSFAFLATFGTSFGTSSPARCSRFEDLVAKLDSSGFPVHARLRLHGEEAGRISSTRLLQLAGVERLPRATDEIWYLGSQAPGGGWRATRVDSKAA